MRKHIVMCTVLALFFNLVFSCPVKGHYPGYTIDAVYGSAPTVDAIVHQPPDPEWNDASIIEFNNTVVYLKQDGKSLYIGFFLQDGSWYPDYDVIRLGIDVNHDGGAFPKTDDIEFNITRYGVPQERHGDNPPTPPIGGWSVAVHDEYFDGWMAEFNITFAKIEVTHGEEKTLGIIFGSTDRYAQDSPLEVTYLWPPVTPVEGNSPSNWADLTSEADWMPEFPPFIVLPILMALTMLALVFSKRRILRKLET